MEDTGAETAAVGLELRRNHAERLVRDRLVGVVDAYVHRSSWQLSGKRPEPFVAVIARHEGARSEIREALADVAGLSDREWLSDWIPLSLGDWMIRVFPEAECATGLA